MLKFLNGSHGEEVVSVVVSRIRRRGRYCFHSRVSVHISGGSPPSPVGTAWCTPHQKTGWAFRPIIRPDGCTVQSEDWMRVPPPVSTGWVHPNTFRQEIDQQSEHLLRGGRCASCAYSVGLSCSIWIRPVTEIFVTNSRRPRFNNKTHRDWLVKKAVQEFIETICVCSSEFRICVRISVSEQGGIPPKEQPFSFLLYFSLLWLPVHFGLLCPMLVSCDITIFYNVLQQSLLFRLFHVVVCCCRLLCVVAGYCMLLQVIVCCCRLFYFVEDCCSVTLIVGWGTLCCCSLLLRCWFPP